MRIAGLLLLTACLSACGSQDEPSEPSETAEEDQRAAREALQDPARREALRERLEELQRSRGDDAERQERPAGVSEDRRRPGRSRSESGREGPGRGRALQRWWENEALAGELGLSSEQSDEIARAHAEAVKAARQSRRSLMQVSTGLSTALAGREPERLDELLEQRVAALEARARAEADWTRRVFEILDQQQWQIITEAKPELLGAILSPLR